MKVCNFFTLNLCGVVVFTFAATNAVVNMKIAPSHDAPEQDWAYVTVRPKAHMFYWLYKTTHSSGYENRPLILWLQGGPGASSTGFGNFLELGPLDVNLKPRNTTWVQTASVLFIDNPVGTGYSYVEDNKAYTKDVAEISADLLTCMQAFMKKHKDFAKVPFYIFSESYGGKMTAAFSAVLYQAVKDGKIDINFKGLAMGDSWIAPVDIVRSWGPYLYATSLIDRSGLEQLAKESAKIKSLVEKGQFSEATSEWSIMEGLVEDVTGGVSFYNILKDHDDASLSPAEWRKLPPSERFFRRHIGIYHEQSLAELMNGPIKDKLKIIPDDVTWGGQAGEVFQNQKVDFMKSVLSTVNDLINNTTLTVVIYEGQLDLICDAVGAEDWFSQLDVAKHFKSAKRDKQSCDKMDSCFYVQEYKNVQFYWILLSGHMVPQDNGPGALAMVNRVIGN